MKNVFPFWILSNVTIYVSYLTAGKFLQNNKKEVTIMSWKRTSIAITMANPKYPKGVKVFNFNNVIPDPTREQLDMFAEGLVLLSNGDVYGGVEIIKHDELDAE